MKIFEDINSLNLDKMIDNSGAKIQKFKNQFDTFDFKAKEAELNLEKEERKLKMLKQKKQDKNKK
jgi:hypothetical protein